MQNQSILPILSPCLFLMGENEAEEFKRQAAEALNRHGIEVTLRECTAAEGADVHCRINSLRLVHIAVFDWLCQVFDTKEMSEKIDIRMLRFIFAI